MISTYVITRVDGTTLALYDKTKPSTVVSAKQNVELLSNDTVDVSVKSAVPLKFYIGDKIMVIGRDYTLNTPAKEKKVADNLFLYDLHFEGVQYDLLRAAYSVNVDTSNGKVQDLNGDSLTGDIKMFLDVFLANANRVFGAGKWSLGTYPAGTKTITLTFSDTDNCLSVLQNLCSEANFNTEFDIVIDGSGNRTLNIGPVGKIFTYTFEHGKGNGLYDLTRDKVSSANIVTRLNAFGSSRNIITPKYRASKLCLPGKTKGSSYLEDAAAKLKYGIWEATKNFEDIYPNRTGTISSLGDSTLKFLDTSMDFDLNAKEVDGITAKYLMSGTPAKIHFNTGNLAGYEFEIHEYNAATKQFTLVSQTDENNYTFPSTTSSAFQFAIGDKYVILDIYLPQSYIDTAEAALATAGAAYLARYCQPLVQYTLTLESLFLKNIVGAAVDSNIIWVGDHIPISDTDLEVNKSIRVKGFGRDLLKDYSYTLTIADLTVSVSTISRVITDLNGIEKIVRINNLNDPAKARRNYLSSQEVLNMVFDPEGDFYTEKIKPLSIDTTMLSVGAKSMQFGLVGTIFQPNYAGAKNRIVYTGGVITHYAILDVSSNPRTWNITDGDITLATDAAYYVYAKCARVGTGASILFSLTKIAAESDATYYHFLIGVINSVDANNTRALALMYGFTTVNGRFIRTGRIASADGTTYFDLDAGEFKGTFKFSSGTNVETAVGTATTNAASAVSTANAAQSAATSAATAAANAATAASNSQTDATNALNQLTNITSDNVLSAAEKGEQRSDWNVIAAEYGGLITQANLFGISAELTSYTAYFQVLANYLNAGTFWSSGIPSWLADANLGTNTTIVGATYRTNWKNYYDSRTTLLNAVSAKAKTLADAAQTSANTATTNAANAQTAANNAQTDASNALGQLTNIVSDNVLSASEKSGQRSEWNIIAGEKSGIDTQATAFSVTTEKTAYDNAFQALATYLNNGTTWSSGIPSWLADASLATNTTIVGATYRTNWQTLYNTRTTLLNAISTKAKALADAAQAQATTATTNAATAQTAANNAASAASTAQSDATNALNQLTNIVSDNVLSSVEKSSQRQEWNVIAAQKAGINTQATNFSITTENTTYNNAFQALATYLNAGTTWSAGIPSWLADANLATNTTIVGATFRTTWETFYSARQALLNAISAKAKTIADAAQTTANTASTNASTALSTANSAASAASAAQSDASNALGQLTNITSDNVLSSAEKSAQRQDWNVIAAEKAGINTQATSYSITTENTAYNNAFQALATYLNAGTTWSSGVPSWLADANLNTNTTIVGSTYRSTWETFYTARQALLNAIYAKAKTIADAASTTASSAQTAADGKAKHYTGSSNPTTPYVQGRDIWTNGTDLYECAVTRASGSYVAGDFVKATGYDNTKTVIDGGMVTSGTLQVAGDATILAGITGQNTGNTAVRFWAGSAFASRDTAPFRVLQDGSVVMTKAAMTSANISGAIEALSGKIGDWVISSGGIINDTDTAYIIARLTGTSGTAESRIGSNVVSPAAGITIPAWIMNTIENAAGTNIALKLSAAHGAKNYALHATGDIIMVAGNSISSKMNYMNLFTGSVNVISISLGLRVHARNMSRSSKTLYLPSLSEIRSDLNTDTFSVTSAADVTYAASTAYYAEKGNGLFVGDAIKYGASAYQTIISIDRSYSIFDIINVETTLGVTVANGGTFTALHEFSIEMSIVGEGSESVSVINVYPNGATWMNNAGTSLTSLTLGRGSVINVVAYTKRNTMYYQLINYRTS